MPANALLVLMPVTVLQFLVLFDRFHGLAQHCGKSLVVINVLS